jgi:hypothetical protein
MQAAPGSMAAALLLLLATATGTRLGDLARRDSGDVFTLLGMFLNHSLLMSPLLDHRPSL